MPIPDFNANGVLPPHTGDPTSAANVSPYPATPLELGRKLGFTPERRAILSGWLAFRRTLRLAGFAQAVQWVDGSFVQDVETTESRPPGDLDVITFYWPPDSSFNARVAAANPEMGDHALTRANHRCDHYFLDLSFNPFGTVDAMAFWCGLFSHRRDGVWKGLLRVELGRQSDDDALEQWIRQQP